MAYEGYEGWIGGDPPAEWERVLAMDVGGSSPNALVWAAIDPSGYLIAYDEIYLVTTDMRKLADLALPKMKGGDQEFRFKFKVGDYENRVALADMAKYGIRFDNAVKHSKITSVHRLAGYLHPNPRRPFPVWHPKAGEFGSPLLFITSRCKNLIRELPQQRWKEGAGETMKDELDRTIANHAVDCLLYIVRMLPAPTDVKVAVAANPNAKKIDLRSALYWEDVKRQREKVQGEKRRPYRPSHQMEGL